MTKQYLNFAGVGAAVPDPEAADADRLKAYGELAWLYMRSPMHARTSIRAARAWLQPPIDLQFYHVFRQDEVPRAAILWAYLSPQAEGRFVRGEGLRPADWRSGRQMWLMEIIAPYGQGTAPFIFRWLTRVIPPVIPSIRFLRVDAEGRMRRVVEGTRGATGKPVVRPIPLAAFDGDPGPGVGGRDTVTGD